MTGKDIILVKNKKYWDTSHQPHLDKIIMKFIADTQSQLAQASSGEIQYGMDYRLALLADLLNVAKGGKLKVETIPESGAEKIDLNLCDNAKGLCGDQATKSPFTADVKVRQAIIKAIDRQSIVKTIASGETVVPADSWIYLGAEFIKTTPDQDPTTAYDPAAAKTLLDEAGYKLSPSCHGGAGRADSSGRCLDLGFVTTSGNTARMNAQIAIQAQLQAVGIFTNLSTVKSGKLFGGFADGGLLYTHQFQMAMYTNTLSTPAEPDSWFSGYHADCGGTCAQFNQIPSSANSGQGQNDTGEDNPQVDHFFDQGRSSVDLTVRAKAYKSAESLLAKDPPRSLSTSRSWSTARPTGSTGCSRTTSSGPSTCTTGTATRASAPGRPGVLDPGRPPWAPRADRGRRQGPLVYSGRSGWEPGGGPTI